MRLHKASRHAAEEKTATIDSTTGTGAGTGTLRAATLGVPRFRIHAVRKSGVPDPDPDDSTSRRREREWNGNAASCNVQRRVSARFGNEVRRGMTRRPRTRKSPPTDGFQRPTAEESPDSGTRVRTMTAAFPFLPVLSFPFARASPASRLPAPGFGRTTGPGACDLQGGMECWSLRWEALFVLFGRRGRHGHGNEG